MNPTTDARLEVQGVYGDGWEEGIERTRGRAVMDGRRESQLPPAKNDTLSEQERKALAKVDRYAFGFPVCNDAKLIRGTGMDSSIRL